MTLIGRLQKIQLHQGGKTIIVLPQDPSTQADWHPEDATRINGFCDLCVGTIRAHGLYAMKSLGFSQQLERDSQSRVFCTVNRLKLRAEWINGLSTAF